MQIKHKKQFLICSSKLYLCLLFAIGLSFLMIPAVSFATNFADGQNDNSLAEDIQNNEDKSSIFTNPVAEQNNINNLGVSSNYLSLKPHNDGETAKFQIWYVHYEGEQYEKPDLKYSNNLVEWYDVNFDKVIDNENKAANFEIDNPIYFKGNNPQSFNIPGSGEIHHGIKFYITEDEIDACGSIMSLIDNGMGTVEIPSTVTFAELFYASSKLVTSPELPAVVFSSEDVYRNMFAFCSSLRTAPVLPALTTTRNCYYYMFAWCISLQYGPDLPATQLANSCYYGMFALSGLKKSPIIAATSGNLGCLEQMFAFCQNLTQISVCFSSWSAVDTTNWVSGVNTIGTFCCPNELTWETGDSRIPPNWTKKIIEKATGDVLSYSNQYDGSPHGVSIVNKYPEDATVLYSEDDSSYSETPITRTDVGYTFVYLRIVKDGYTDYKTSATIQIRPKGGATATVGAKEKYYGEEDPTFDVAFTNIEGANPVLGTDYVLEREKGETVKPNDGTYEVKLHWIRDNNYDLSITNGTLKINKTNDLKLVANPASKVEGSPDPILTAHMVGLKFDDSFDPTNYDYYQIKQVTESNSTITLQPELTDAGKVFYGQNYDVDVTGFSQASTLTVYATAGELAFTYTTNAFNINYNGQENEFKVNVNNPPSGVIVEYKTSQEGSYSQTTPKFKDADTYTVYFRISAAGYSTVETSQQVKINPAPATLVADSDKLYKNKGGSEPELSATLYGAVGGESLVKGTDYNISRTTGEEPGTYSVTITVEQGTDTTKNYSIVAPSAVFTILGAASTFKYSVDAYDSVYDGQQHEFKINVEDPASDYTVKYKYGESGWVYDTFKFKNFGEYTVQFQISATGFTTVEGRKTLKIAKAKASLVADISKCFKNVGDFDPELDAFLYGAAGTETLIKGTDFNISRTEGEDTGVYDVAINLIENSEKTNNYDIQIVPAKFFILGSGDVPPVPPTPPTPPTPDDPGTNPSFVNSIIAQTGDGNFPIVVALIVVACACGGYVACRKLRKK